MTPSETEVKGIDAAYFQRSLHRVSVSGRAVNAKWNRFLSDVLLPFTKERDVSAEGPGLEKFFSMF